VSVLYRDGIDESKQRYRRERKNCLAGTSYLNTIISALELNSISKLSGVGAIPRSSSILDTNVDNGCASRTTEVVWMMKVFWMASLTTEQARSGSCSVTARLGIWVPTASTAKSSGRYAPFQRFVHCMCSYAPSGTMLEVCVVVKERDSS
jgi:hypothetical protein